MKSFTFKDALEYITDGVQFTVNCQSYKAKRWAYPPMDLDKECKLEIDKDGIRISYIPKINRLKFATWVEYDQWCVEIQDFEDFKNNLQIDGWNSSDELIFVEYGGLMLQIEWNATADKWSIYEPSETYSICMSNGDIEEVANEVLNELHSNQY